MFQVWIFGWSLTPLPVDKTLITVDAWEYPTPPDIILTSVSLLFSMTGVRIAPTPSPVISKSGRAI